MFYSYTPSKLHCLAAMESQVEYEQTVTRLSLFADGKYTETDVEIDIAILHCFGSFEYCNGNVSQIRSFILTTRGYYHLDYIFGFVDGKLSQKFYLLEIEEPLQDGEDTYTEIQHQ
jgi:hypothetical protein